MDLRALRKRYFRIFPYTAVPMLAVGGWNVVTRFAPCWMGHECDLPADMITPEYALLMLALLFVAPLVFALLGIEI